MALSLPVSHGLFHQVQEGLRHIKGNRFTLTHGVQYYSAYIRWLATYMDDHPTQIFELVPLNPTVDVYHDASGEIFGGIFLPGPAVVSRVIQQHPSAALTSQDPVHRDVIEVKTLPGMVVCRPCAQ